MRKLFALVAAAASLAAVTPAVAQAPTVALSIGMLGGGPQGPQATVTYGESVRLSGSISPARSGETILMEVRPLSGRIENRTLITDAQGKFELIHQPKRRTEYGIFGGEHGPYSRPVYASVKPKVVLRVLSARLAKFSVKVTADPSPDQYLRWAAWLEVRVSKRPVRWRQVVDGVVLSRKHTATFTAPLPPGTQSVRLRVSEAVGYESAYSPVVLVRR